MSPAWFAARGRHWAAVPRPAGDRGCPGLSGNSLEHFVLQKQPEIYQGGLWIYSMLDDKDDKDHKDDDDDDDDEDDDDA